MKIAMLLSLLIINAVVCQKELPQSSVSKNLFKESGARRKLKTMQFMDECFEGVNTCLDGCFYKFVDRDCRGEDSIIPYIMGSEEIIAENYPFLISFRKSRVNKFQIPIEGCKEHFCGGVLIWNDVVLTAAHCLDDLLDEQSSTLPRFNQKVWATRASKCRHLDGIEEVLSYEAIIHPEYDSSTLNNDIAMVILRGEMKNTFGFINFIDSKNYDQQDTTASALGYGNTVLESKEKESLPARKASLQLIQEELCKLSMPDTISNDTIDYKQMLCVWSTQADTCKGDSGGPLYVQSDESETVLIGLSSWGPNNQCKKTEGVQPPSVFTRVSTYTDWILNNIQTFSVNPMYPVSTAISTAGPDTTNTTSEGDPGEDKFGTVPLCNEESLITNIDENMSLTPAVDNREVVSNTTCYPASTIVLVERSIAGDEKNRQFCTGVIISPNAVLTGGVCADDNMDDLQIDVQPGLNEVVTPFGRVQVNKTIVQPDMYTDSLEQKFGVLILQTTVGEETGWMDLKSNKSSELDPFQVILQGYEAFQEEGIQIRQTCTASVSADDAFLLQHNCYTSAGTSGSPLYMPKKDSTNGFEVVGVHGGQRLGFKYGALLSDESIDWIKRAIKQ